MSYRLLENSRPPVCKRDGLLCLIRSPSSESQLGRVFQAHRKVMAVYLSNKGQSLSFIRRLREHVGGGGSGSRAQRVLHSHQGVAEPGRVYRQKR